MMLHIEICRFSSTSTLTGSKSPLALHLEQCLDREQEFIHKKTSFMHDSEERDA